MDPDHHFENSAAEAVEGNWKLFVGFLREKWGDLTDDDLQRMKGRREQVVGYLQERSAEEREKVEREVDDIARRSNYSW